MRARQGNESAAAWFRPALRVLGCCFFCGLAGIGFVWQKDQIYELGQQIRQWEHRLDEVRIQNKQLNDLLEDLRSPRSLTERARQLELGLVPAQATQMVRLVEAPVMAADPGSWGLTNGGAAGSPRITKNGFIASQLHPLGNGKE